MTDNTKLRIKDWAEEDRPREKLLTKGVGALSDAELLAILIGSGNKNETAVELAQRILFAQNNNLNILGKLSVNELIKNFNGIGEAKAITIIAALELGKRRKLAEVIIQPRITTSQDVYDVFHPILGDLAHEEMWVLYLNRSNKILKKTQLSKGGVAGTVVDVRMVMKEALETLASGVIICHNHPSGIAQPSGADDEVTRKLEGAGLLLDIKLHDHLIICDGSYYSYQDEGRL